MNCRFWPTSGEGQAAEPPSKPDTEAAETTNLPQLGEPTIPPLPEDGHPSGTYIESTYQGE